jgi:hypothetical protein
MPWPSSAVVHSGAQTFGDPEQPSVPARSYAWSEALSSSQVDANSTDAEADTPTVRSAANGIVRPACTRGAIYFRARMLTTQTSSAHRRPA